MPDGLVQIILFFVVPLHEEWIWLTHIMEEREKIKWWCTWFSNSKHICHIHSLTMRMLTCLPCLLSLDPLKVPSIQKVKMDSSCSPESNESLSSFPALYASHLLEVLISSPNTVCELGHMSFRYGYLYAEVIPLEFIPALKEHMMPARGVWCVVPFPTMALGEMTLLSRRSSTGHNSKE